MKNIFKGLFGFLIGLFLTFVAYKICIGVVVISVSLFAIIFTVFAGIFLLMFICTKKHILFNIFLLLAILIVLLKSLPYWIIGIIIMIFLIKLIKFHQ